MLKRLNYDLVGYHLTKTGVRNGMANPGDWLQLYTRWGKTNHQKGDPKLDALREMFARQGLSWKDRANELGAYYRANTPTSAATVGTTTYAVFKANATQVRVVDLTRDTNYSSIANGEFAVRTNLYFQGSNKNTWSYTGGVEIRRGTNQNLNFLNSVSISSIVESPTVDVAGQQDVIASFVQFYRDSQGSRDTLTGVEASFFNNGRFLILPPGAEILVENIYSGDVGNVANTATFYDFIEGDLNAI